LAYQLIIVISIIDCELYSHSSEFRNSFEKVSSAFAGYPRITV